MCIMVDIGLVVFNKLLKFSAKFVSAPHSVDEGVGTQRSGESLPRVTVILFRGTTSAWLQNSLLNVIHAWKRLLNESRYQLIFFSVQWNVEKKKKAQANTTVGVLNREFCFSRFYCIQKLPLASPIPPNMPDRRGWEQEAAITLQALAPIEFSTVTAVSFPHQSEAAGAALWSLSLEWWRSRRRNDFPPCITFRFW